MPSGGMRWNSKLPKAGAGRAPGPQNSDNTNPDGQRHAGRKGGQPNRNGEIRGKHKKAEPEPTPVLGASLIDLEEGAREIRSILTDKDHREKFIELIDMAFAKAIDGNYRFYEDLMNRFGGKPVVTQANIIGDMSGDETAALAEQVEKNFEAGGLRLVPREDEVADG